MRKATIRVNNIRVGRTVVDCTNGARSEQQADLRPCHSSVNAATNSKRTFLVAATLCGWEAPESLGTLRNVRECILALRARVSPPSFEPQSQCWLHKPCLTIVVKASLFVFVSLGMSRVSFFVQPSPPHLWVRNDILQHPLPDLIAAVQNLHQ